MQVFSALQFIQEIKQPSINQILTKKKYLPRRDSCKGKKTLVFDLDETLIHCNDDPEEKGDIKLPIRYDTGEIMDVKNLFRHQ